MLHPFYIWKTKKVKYKEIVFTLYCHRRIDTVHVEYHNVSGFFGLDSEGKHSWFVEGVPILVTKNNGRFYGRTSDHYIMVGHEESSDEAAMHALLDAMIDEHKNQLMKLHNRLQKAAKYEIAANNFNSFLGNL